MAPDAAQRCDWVGGVRVALLLATAMLLTLTGCSGEAAADGPVTVDVSIAGGKTEPSGKTVKVAKGAEITLRITSDIDDEIHVHSTPDHSFPVTAGQASEERFSFDTPGTYEMESHKLDKLIAKFEVR
jgi:hypothetical protein